MKIPLPEPSHVPRFDGRPDSRPVNPNAERQMPELTQPGLHEALEERVVRLPGLNRETPILDLGCGSGAWLARLSYNGFKNLHGVDNQSIVGFPNQPVPFSCSYADLNSDPDLGLGEKTYGLITAIEVIEHLHNPGWLFRLVSNHMSPEGYFLLTTPNIHSIRARVRFAATGKLAGFDPTNVPAEPTHLYPVFITCLDRLLCSYDLIALERWTFPPNRGRASRPLARIAAGVLEAMFPNDHPGDTLCVLVQRA
jgi:2-polyprenyl-3-methyl-5-hydroxy-6-metoxy-1,4-benzoquinol methylase